MTDKQLLEQALEALEELSNEVTYHFEDDEVGRKVCCGEVSYRPHLPDCHAIKAITAIRARLEQPEQEPVAKPKLIGWRTADFLNETNDIRSAKNWEVHYEVLPIFEGDPNTKLATPPAAPVQEPVAYVVTTEVHGQMCSFIHRIDLTKLLPDGAKLYTTPPAAQRQWVGLTADDVWQSNEVMALNAEMGLTMVQIMALMVWANAKLREKNGDAA